MATPVPAQTQLSAVELFQQLKKCDEYTRTALKVDLTEIPSLKAEVLAYLTGASESQSDSKIQLTNRIANILHLEHLPPNSNIADHIRYLIELETLCDASNSPFSKAPVSRQVITEMKGNLISKIPPDVLNAYLLKEKEEAEAACVQIKSASNYQEIKDAINNKRPIFATALIDTALTEKGLPNNSMRVNYVRYLIETEILEAKIQLVRSHPPRNLLQLDAQLDMLRETQERINAIWTQKIPNLYVPTNPITGEQIEVPQQIVSMRQQIISLKTRLTDATPKLQSHDQQAKTAATQVFNLENWKTASKSNRWLAFRRGSLFTKGGLKELDELVAQYSKLLARNEFNQTVERNKHLLLQDNEEMTEKLKEIITKGIQILGNPKKNRVNEDRLPAIKTLVEQSIAELRRVSLHPESIWKFLAEQIFRNFPNQETILPLRPLMSPPEGMPIGYDGIIAHLNKQPPQDQHKTKTPTDLILDLVKSLTESEPAYIAAHPAPATSSPSPQRLDQPRIAVLLKSAPAAGAPPAPQPGGTPPMPAAPPPMPVAPIDQHQQSETPNPEPSTAPSFGAHA